MFKRTTIFALAASLLAFTASPAVAQDEERLTEIVEAEAESGDFMGAVLVTNGDTIILDRAWGSADLEWDIANTTDTKFRIGSVTKQFTSVAIFLLHERGMLDIDAPISTYLEDTPEAWSEITVRQLMRHTSGLPNVTSLPEFGPASVTPLSQDELIGMFRDLPLDFEPGTQFDYSNSGYVLLSRIVENVSGESIGDFFEANLFAPLGMEATGFDNSSEILPLRADGYSPSDSGIINADYVYMGIPTGAGALYSTTGDLHKWQRGLFGGEILSAESLADYLTPSDHEGFGGNGYAHGVLVSEDGDNTFYWHGGGIQGFNSWLGYDPEREVTVVVLANLNGGSANKIGQQLFTIIQGGEIVLPDERQEVALDTSEYAQYEGTYALTPQFKIAIFVEEDRLMTQATGQEAFEIYPEGPDQFFLRVVDAQLRFNRDDNGDIVSVTLFQNGNEIEGAKE